MGSPANFSSSYFYKLRTHPTALFLSPSKNKSQFLSLLLSLSLSFIFSFSSSICTNLSSIFIKVCLSQKILIFSKFSISLCFFLQVDHCFSFSFFFFGLMLINCEFDVFKDVCLSPIMPNICLDDRFCVFSSF